VDGCVGAIVEQYADDFNSTYERGEGGIKVTNPTRFQEIVKEVQEIIKRDVKAAKLPDNKFMRSALLATVFEFDVLQEVMKVLA
jgi:hypothetical protein